MALIKHISWILLCISIATFDVKVTGSTTPGGVTVMSHEMDQGDKTTGGEDITTVPSMDSTEKVATVEAVSDEGTEEPAVVESGQTTVQPDEPVQATESPTAEPVQQTDDEPDITVAPAAEDSIASTQASEQGEVVTEGAAEEEISEEDVTSEAPEAGAEPQTAIVEPVTTGDTPDSQVTQDEQDGTTIASVDDVVAGGSEEATTQPGAGTEETTETVEATTGAQGAPDAIQGGDADDATTESEVEQETVEATTGAQGAPDAIQGGDADDATTESEVEQENIAGTTETVTVETSKTPFDVKLDITKFKQIIPETTSTIPDSTKVDDVETTSVVELPRITTQGGEPTTESETTSGKPEEKGVTTEAVETTSEKQGTAAVTVAEPVDLNDPCNTRTVLEHNDRHFSEEGTTERCDVTQEGWYAFKYNDQWAEIPHVPIKKGYCSAKWPFRLDLDEQALPALNEVVTVDLCTSSKLEGSEDIETCVLRKEIEVKKCDSYYIYKLHQLRSSCDWAICTQLKGDNIPNKVLANSTSDEEIEPAAKTWPNQKNVEDLSKEEKSSTVTATFSGVAEDDLEAFMEQYRKLLLKYLSENYEVDVQPTEAMEEEITASDDKSEAEEDEEVATATNFVADVNDDSQNSVINENNPTSSPDNGMRYRRDAAVTEEPQFTIIPVGPTPRFNKDGELELAIIVKDKDGNVIPADVLKKAIENMESPSDDSNVQLEKVYEGLPLDMTPTSSPSKQKKDIWEAHMGLWITIIVLCAVCLITLIVCCLCFRCCDTEDASPEKSPLQMEEGKKVPSVVIENPLSDEQIMRDEAPMVEHENPAFTSNGGGQHLAKDEDNGWIVPLEQLTDADKQKADVENTKL